MDSTNETTAYRVLQAAEEEFLAKGYAGAKTVEIARKAGVTHAMLHYYYRTKEQLFYKVYESKVAALAQSLIDALNVPGQSFEERLRLGIGRHFDFLAANPSLPRFFVIEVASNPRHWERARELMSATLKRVLASLQAEMDALIAERRIAPIHVIDLLLDVVSLNAFVFMVQPVLEPLLLRGEDQRRAFIERRKAENVELIMRRLSPDLSPQRNPSHR